MRPVGGTGDRSDKCGRSEHNGREEHIAKKGMAEKRHPGRVAGHQARDRLWIPVPAGPDSKIADHEKGNGTHECGSADPQPIRVFAQPCSNPQDRGIPRPGHQLVRGEWVRIHKLRENNVGGGEQGERHPELTPRTARAKIEKCCSHRSEIPGMRHEWHSRHDRKDDKKISQTDSPRKSSLGLLRDGMLAVKGGFAALRRPEHGLGGWNCYP